MAQQDDSKKKGLMPEDEGQIPPPPGLKSQVENEGQNPPPSQLYAYYTVGTASIFLIIYIIYNIFFCGCR